jgi:hypothetical protein
MRHNEEGHRNISKLTYDQKRSGEDCTIIRRHSTNSAHVERNSKRDNCSDWNRLKITQTVPEQHNGKARN